jgi:hypothetical protein
MRRGQEQPSKAIKKPPHKPCSGMVLVLRETVLAVARRPAAPLTLPTDYGRILQHFECAVVRCVLQNKSGGMNKNAHEQFTKDWGKFKITLAQFGGDEMVCGGVRPYTPRKMLAEYGIKA